MKSALVLTNHLHAWAGSEILALEVAEALKGASYDVTISANVISNELLIECRRLGFNFASPDKIDVREFKFIWSQHFVLPLCNGFEALGEFRGTLISAHLSPYMPFELAQLGLSKAIGARIIANSAETVNKIQSNTKKEGRWWKVKNFENATLSSFQEENPVLRVADVPKSVLVVSNHVPTEIIQAGKILRSRNITVDYFGVGQDNYRRIVNDDLVKYDVVIAIGKTVQQAMLARRAVYCYDRFGGPGYINTENAEKSLNFNFSGRCCCVKKDGYDISQEIINHFKASAGQVNLLFDAFQSRFSIENLLKELEAEETLLSVDNIDVFSTVQTANLIRELYIRNYRLGSAA